MASTPAHTFHSKGPALSSVLAGGSTWERGLVAIEPAARATLVSTLAALVLVIIGQHYLADRIPLTATPSFYLFGWPWAKELIHRAVSLTPLYVGLALPLAALAALTNGFAIAGRRLQIGLAILATASLLSLLPPFGLLLITVANLGAWIVLGVLTVVAGGLVVWALLTGLDS